MSLVRMATWLTPFSSMLEPPVGLSAGSDGSPADCAFAELPAQPFLELLNCRARMSFAQLLEVRVARVTLGIPLVGEPSRRDVVDQAAHRRHDVEIRVGIPSGELAVLA